MNRRGFLRSLASVPAIPLVASLPALAPADSIPGVTYGFQQYGLGFEIEPWQEEILGAMHKNMDNTLEAGLKKLFNDEYSRYAVDFEGAFS